MIIFQAYGQEHVDRVYIYNLYSQRLLNSTGATILSEQHCYTILQLRDDYFVARGMGNGGSKNRTTCYTHALVPVSKTLEQWKAQPKLPSKYLSTRRGADDIPIQSPYIHTLPYRDSAIHCG